MNREFLADTVSVATEISYVAATGRLIDTLRQSRNHPPRKRKEGDLIIGVNRSAIATLIDRTTRFALLVHLPRQTGYGLIKLKKNSPVLAGYGAVTTKNALVRTFEVLPAGLRRSLTWDRGKEMSAHALLTREIGLPVYFADAKSPWQRGSNEHLNGLLRQYFPKGTDISRWTTRELQAVADTINKRPRGILGWRTPTEALADQLRSAQETTVASTGRIRPIRLSTDHRLRRRERHYTVDGLHRRLLGIKAMAQSFFATLKTEFYYRRVWPTRKRARIEIGAWIEDRFNRRRWHASLRQVSPVNFELRYSHQTAELKAAVEPRVPQPASGPLGTRAARCVAAGVSSIESPIQVRKAAVNRSRPGDLFTPGTVPGSRPVQMSFGYQLYARTNLRPGLTR